MAFAAIGVAAVVIAAAVFLLATQVPSGPPAPAQPVVVLSASPEGSSSGTVQVVSASAAVVPKYYQVGLVANGTTMMGPSPMPVMSGGSVQFTLSMGMSSMMFTVTWMDRGTMGSMDRGDSFYVNRSSGMMGCIAMDMDFGLLWWNGSMVAHAPFSWTCQPKPVVTFSSPTVTSTYVVFSVAGATPIVSISSFKFNLRLNGVSAATAVALSAGNRTIAVGNNTFYVLYTDVSGNGNLKPGDALKIGMVGGGSLPAGSYSFFLIWAADGSSITIVNWNL